MLRPTLYKTVQYISSTVGQKTKSHKIY